mmetsp:Transcript_13646/g.20449  ORF Transcript_13646/g.20449 Transcript_13646/m.20449 type:complete len:156 (-) Transcript_13646:78-545(-)
MKPKTNGSTIESSTAESKEDYDDAREITCSQNSQTSFECNKPGQRFPTPSPGSGDRVFYDTLLVQRPDSEMAQEWCVSHGTLEYDHAEKLYRIICKRKGKEYDFKGSTSKRAAPNTSKSRAPSNKNRKIIDETNQSCDTGLAVGSVWEGQGSSGL